MPFPARHFCLPTTQVVRLFLLFVLATALIGACGGGSKDHAPAPLDETPGATVIPTEPPPVRIAPLTGEVIDEAHFSAIENRRPLAVIIDNIITATPQAGLDQADVVI